MQECRSGLGHGFEPVGALTGRPRARGAGKTGFGSLQQDFEFGGEPFGLAASSGLVVARLLDRFVGAVAGVNRVIEREPVIATRDGIVVFLQRFFGGLEGRRRVRRGIGRFGSSNRAVGLMSFFGRWLRAPDGEPDKKDTAAAEADRPRRKGTEAQRLQYSVPVL